jgi:hypothetical protein
MGVCDGRHGGWYGLNCEDATNWRNGCIGCVEIVGRMQCGGRWERRVSGGV